MSQSIEFPLYDLLPAVYRIDDEKHGAPLRALLSVIEEQAGKLKQNIDQLYADFFIETCGEWVIPYLGELVGNNPLDSILRTRRADVARTLYYRRRKGTLPALEELARDVTGWSIRAAPFFEWLVWTQNVNHVRDAAKTVAIRDLQTMDLCRGPFEKTAHSLDIREMGPTAGRYHPKRVGFFSWRLNNYHIETSTACREAAPDDHGFHFSPFGLRTRLFQRPDDLERGALAEERHIRQPIRATAFFAGMAQFYDASVTPSVRSHDEAGVSAQRAIIPMDLSAFAQPPGDFVGIDVRRGMISFDPDKIPAQAEVSYPGTDPQFAERENAPHDHIFRFALLGLRVFHDGGFVPLERYQYMDLSSWSRPPAGRMAVDLGLGRIAFAAGEEPTTRVQYHFGSKGLAVATPADAPNAHGFLVKLPENTNSLRITRDGAPVPLFQLCCMDLTRWARPEALRVGVDVNLGRISFPAGEEPSRVVVSYDYGFSADLGGGAYDRLLPTRPGALVESAAAQALKLPTGVQLTVGGQGCSSIEAALDAWRNQGRPETTITIEDSRSYDESPRLDLAGNALVLQAANNCRPAILGTVAAQGGDGTARVTLSGLWIRDGVAAEGNLESLVISHCTIAPGKANAVQVAAANASIDVTIDRSITGAVDVAPAARLNICDSIVDYDSDAGAIQGNALAGIERSTVFGPVHVREISLISECILTHAITIDRRQAGCVRFSSLPSASQSPRRYRCQPDLALETAPDLEKAAVETRMKPVFTSRAQGDAGYAQLSLAGPKEIATGGEDGGEMGAFQLLQQPRREANLRMRLDEYLPYDLRAGIIYLS